MILCCGEALIDMIPTPVAGGQEGFVPHTGGAVFNTAIALGRLGVRTGLLTGLSTDMFGLQLTDVLTASHVDATLAILSERPTTLAFVRLVDGHATYSFYDDNSAGRMLASEDMPSIPADVSALFFGGISLACEPCADAYATLLAREADGRAVMLDPNIRPDFIRGIDRYRARLGRMLAQTDIVKLSDEDLNWIEPAPLSMNEKVQILLKAGPAIVILTRGGDGATGFLPDGAEVQVPAAIVEISDTVGAGDTFNAGVLAKLSEMGQLRKADLRSLSPDTLREAMTHGAKAAAVTVSRAGANPPWAREL
ncbi:carbohydrate kinase [uncultured Roseovarius sp.]|uniref:carbohydrate kinase family protein n=1 Tax=uncultured Roseovarius sp. TaxID=293344 RepID=UPI00260F16D8|nr:carbohydrate kinase [uncultured Roseovarius sp.]